MTFFNIFSDKPIKSKRKTVIIADNREKNSLVISELIKLKCDVSFNQLPVGDYLINKHVIERKTINDLKSSIIDKRIITQIKGLKQATSPILIIEGVNDKMYQGIIHENAFRGFIISFVTNHKIPLVYTLGPEDTAKYLVRLDNGGSISANSLRFARPMMSPQEQMRFIMEGFPGIGPATSKKLFEQFGTIQEIMNAPEEALRKSIGEKASIILELRSKNY